VSNDFVLSNGGGELKLFNSDIHDWTITFVDTGLHASVGERLKAVEPFLDGEEMFLANYADGLTDLWLPDMIEKLRQSGKTAAFLAVRSPQTFHVARVADDDTVEDLIGLGDSDLWINGGFFVLRSEIFDYMRVGEELVSEPFQRLIREQLLIAHRHEGFWRPMDTFKDKMALDQMYESGVTPWETWKKKPPVPGTVGDESAGPHGA
jgi:glucose-1-phosphate cytidylyltransferase